jgi:hypothetical protein
MKEIRASMFPEDARYIHFVPFDAWKKYNSQSRRGHRSDFDALFNRRTGVFGGEQAYRGGMDTSGRLRAVRQMLKLRDDGRAGAVFSKKGCADLIDGFNGGYCYPQLEEIMKNPEKGEEPLKNEYSHEQDALQCMATGYDVVKLMQKNKDKKDVSEEIGLISQETNIRIGT